MDRRRLDALVRLVETGSFQLTAGELSMTQPALSQLIARLEAEVGIKLIDRSTRPVTATQAGKEFYFQSKKVLDAMEGIDSLVSETHHARLGRVRIGIVPAMLFDRPATAVRSFQVGRSNVEVQVQRLITSELVEALDQGSIDVGVLLTVPDLKGVSSEELFSEEYMVCLPAGHPLLAKESVEFSDLEDEPLIHGSRSGNPQGYDSIISACVSAGFSPEFVQLPGYVDRMGSFLDHAGMVSTGMGLSFAPSSFKNLRPNNVEYRPLINPSVGVTASINWFESRLDEVGRAFVRHCIEACK